MGRNKRTTCDHCKKEMRSDHLKRHLGVCRVLHKKENKKLKKIQKKKEKTLGVKAPRQRKSKNFFITKHKRGFFNPKYKLCMRICNRGFDEWLSGVTIGLESGEIKDGNQHIHMVITTKMGYSLEKMKEILKEQYKFVPNDIQSVKKLKDTLRYISKDDYKCYSRGHDKSHLSLKCRAYMASLQTQYIDAVDIPGNLAPWQRKEYMEMFETFVRRDQKAELMRYTEDIKLRRWQKAVVKRLLRQNDRLVMWIYDEEGNQGKSVLGRYLMTFHKALYIESGKKNDIVHTYRNEDIVVLDFTRNRQDSVSYGMIEGLKNGTLFSGKYQSNLKIKPGGAKVLVTANFLPEIKEMSKDRWDIWTLKDGKLMLHSVYDQ